MLARTQSRAGIGALAIVTLVLGSLCAASAPALAADATTATSGATTTTAKCPTPELLSGFEATGATVTTPGAAARTLNQDQITAFLQTWLAYSVFENPPQERPPANLPVSQLDIATLQGGQPQPLVIFYATDGNNAWVGAPAPTPAPPPNDQKWIRVPKPKDTIAAFAGRLAPVCVDPPTSASTTASTTATTIGQASKPDGSSSGSDTPWALIIVGIAVVVGGGAFVAVRSRRRPA